MDQLREEVNPVFHTAESCLLVNAQLGDTDAARILEHLEFYKKVSKSDETNMTPEMREFVAHSLNPGFNAMVEARFGSSSRLILESGYRRVVDLPCGYTPRGIKLARSVWGPCQRTRPLCVSAALTARAEALPCPWAGSAASQHRGVFLFWAMFPDVCSVPSALGGH